MMAGASTPASYAAAVNASNQKLTITRKESEGDGGMDNMDLREVQSAITKMILVPIRVFLSVSKALLSLKVKC